MSRRFPRRQIPNSSSEEEEEQDATMDTPVGEWPEEFEEPVSIHSSRTRALETDMGEEEYRLPRRHFYPRSRQPQHMWDRKQAGWAVGDEKTPPGGIVRDGEEEEDVLGDLPKIDPKLKKQDSIASLDSDDEEETKTERKRSERKDSETLHSENDLMGDDTEDEDEDMPGLHKKKHPARRKTANYLVEGDYNAEPQNEEDHTFSGIMFDLKASDALPIEFVEVQIFWVRGGLGPVRVFTLNGSFRSPPPRNWNCVYAEIHPPTDFRTPFAALELPEPIRIKPGATVGVYIHSALPDDSGIVYSNSRGDITLQDQFITLLPGMAHLNPEPFNDNSPWGFGNAWRAQREFCGRITYGVKWTLWRPRAHMRFCRDFRRFAFILFLCNRSRNHPNTIGIWSLPRDTIMHILHLCSNDWPGSMYGPTDEERCVNKGCKTKGDNRCSRCHVSRYCSRKCQKEDWPVHKLKCDDLAARVSVQPKPKFRAPFSDFQM